MGKMLRSTIDYPVGDKGARVDCFTQSMRDSERLAMVLANAKFTQ